MPGSLQRGKRFDATLEEVLHLITQGYKALWPEAFGFRPGSRLADAMDRARGGRFMGVPSSYPRGAIYSYDVRTCNYECMAARYFYWVLTSMLGGQEFRAGEITNEWRAITRSKVRSMDPAAFSLFSDPEFNLPKKLPDGRYAGKPGPACSPKNPITVPKEPKEPKEPPKVDPSNSYKIMRKLFSEITRLKNENQSIKKQLKQISEKCGSAPTPPKQPSMVPSSPGVLLPPDSTKNWKSEKSRRKAPMMVRNRSN